MAQLHRNGSFRWHDRKYVINRKTDRARSDWSRFQSRSRKRGRGGRTASWHRDIKPPTLFRLTAGAQSFSIFVSAKVPSRFGLPFLPFRAPLPALTTQHLFHRLRAFLSVTCGLHGPRPPAWRRLINEPIFLRGLVLYEMALG